MVSDKTFQGSGGRARVESAVEHAVEGIVIEVGILERGQRLQHRTHLAHIPLAQAII